MINVIELLLGDDTSNFRALEKRTVALVGKETFDRYKGTEGFKARHDYVHEGLAPKWASTVNPWIALAMTVILRAAASARFFKNKKELHSALDLMAMEHTMPEAVSKKIGIAKLRRCLSGFDVPHLAWSHDPFAEP